MATYDELSKFLDDYNPQQEQLGVNFNAPDQDSPYQQMVRERYETPEQAQVQNTEQPGYLSGLLQGRCSARLGRNR